jgi:hypothetical protein
MLRGKPGENAEILREIIARLFFSCWPLGCFLFFSVDKSSFYLWILFLVDATISSSEAGDTREYSKQMTHHQIDY